MDYGTERNDAGFPVANEAHSGQVRMAYRLAESHADRLLHVNGLGWHLWDGARWAPDDIGQARRSVLDVLRTALADSLEDKKLRSDVQRCESATGIAGVLEIASALPCFAASVRDLDADPYLLNVANGTLDLRTFDLHPHRPGDRITKICAAGYDQTLTSTAWQPFINQVLPKEDVREYVQRLAGVSLLGLVVEHILPILTGTGANGKGTWYKALCHALGDYASTAEPELFMHRQGAHPTGEMDLLGRRLVVVSESEKDRRLAEATKKRLTGGDTIRARRMRQDFVEFAPSHTAVLITNHLPKVSGDDPAIWRRLRVIPFEVEIPPEKRNKHLDEQLQADASAVLYWAVQGYRDYSSRGGDMAEPESVLVATGAYQQNSDAVALFIAEECVTSSPAMKATTAHLFDAWAKWAPVNGAESMSQKAFGQALDSHGYPVTTRTSSSKWRTGIALKVKEDDA